MNESSYRRYSTEELKRRTLNGESQTDVARVSNLSDADIRRETIGDPDWEGVPDNWYEQAEDVVVRQKVPVSIRLDHDVIDYFRSSGRGWQTRVNAVLKAYKDAKKSAS